MIHRISHNDILETTFYIDEYHADSFVSALAASGYFVKIKEIFTNTEKNTKHYHIIVTTEPHYSERKVISEPILLTTKVEFRSIEENED